MMPQELSGGMKKRAAVARATALDPEILVFDEPSAGLDPIVAAELDELILFLKRAFQMTIVVVTHEEDIGLRKQLDTAGIWCLRRVCLGRLVGSVLAWPAALELPWPRRRASRSCRRPLRVFRRCSIQGTSAAVASRRTCSSNVAVRALVQPPVSKA